MQKRKLKKLENSDGKIVIKCNGDKKQSRRYSSEVVGFLREKLEQDGKFRSENLQEEKMK